MENSAELSVNSERHHVRMESRRHRIIFSVVSCLAATPISTGSNGEECSSNHHEIQSCLHGLLFLPGLVSGSVPSHTIMNEMRWWWSIYLNSFKHSLYVFPKCVALTTDLWCLDQESSLLVRARLVNAGRAGNPYDWCQMKFSSGLRLHFAVSYLNGVV